VRDDFADLDAVEGDRVRRWSLCAVTSRAWI
jgi:hypothetical protein